MSCHSYTVSLSTQGNSDVVDLTPDVQQVVTDSGVGQGVATVFIGGSTAAITTIEHEPGAIEDLQRALEKLAPAEGPYRHNDLNFDDNGHAHLRAALIGPSESVPISNGRLATGTWQQLVLIDCDTRPRQRHVTVSVTG